MFIAAAVLVVGGCAKSASTGKNDSAKKFLDSWVAIYHPEAKSTALGAWILEEEPGTGEIVGSYESAPFVYVDYTTRTLDGEIQATTYAKTAQQLGTYDATYYYGPKLWERTDGYLAAGLDETISGMREGGRVKIILPGWLSSSERYDTVQGYLDNVSGTNMIYDITVRERIEDIEKWELDSLVSFVGRNFPTVNVADTVDHETNSYGFYYIRTRKTDLPDSTYTADTQVYLNYTGKLLNGTVFDTTLEKTAKDNGLYSSSNTYEPTYVTWADDYTDITLGSSASSTIDGFAHAISLMQPHEEGIAIFLSAQGYQESGSGNAIPEYSPLIFELQLVDKED